MVLALMIAGVVILTFSIWAWRRNNRISATEMSPLRRTLWRWRWAFGMALSVGSYFLRYPLDGGTDQYTVYGIPFMSYAFDQRGHDYVGMLTMPAIALNFVTWVLVPQAIFWLTSRRAIKQPASNDA